MNTQLLLDIIARQSWLKPIDKALASIVESTINAAGQPVKNFLHGTWLGHPLHPAIVGLPLGAWATAALCDTYETVSGDDHFAAAADVCVGVGILGAVGAAVSGMTDWQHTDKTARSAGLVHALLNIAATGCYIVSWHQRRSADRKAGIFSGFLGFGMVMSSAWLGGELVYHQKVGVDHAQRSGPKDWTAVMAERDLPESKPHKVVVKGVDICLVKKDEHIFAIGNKCSHMGGPLAKGKLKGEAIICPWHESRFSLTDGSVLDGPATMPQPCFNVRVRDGQIEVRSLS